MKIIPDWVQYSLCYSRRKMRNDWLHFPGWHKHIVFTQWGLNGRVMSPRASQSMIIWPLVWLQLGPRLAAELHSGLFSAAVGGEIASAVMNFNPVWVLNVTEGTTLKPLPLMSTFGPLVIRKWHRRTTKRARKDADVSCVGAETRLFEILGGVLYGFVL